MRYHGWKIILVIYGAVFAFFTAVFLLSFRTFLFGSQEVLFYRGIGLLAVSFLISLAAALAVFFKIGKSHLESLVAAVVVSAAIHLSLFIVLPVTFDRSVTMYLLTTLERAEGSPSCRGLSQSDLRTKLISEYVIERDAVARRLNEQKAIDTLTGAEQCVQLTSNGLNFLKFSRITGKIYGLKKF